MGKGAFSCLLELTQETTSTAVIVRFVKHCHAPSSPYIASSSGPALPRMRSRSSPRDSNAEAVPGFSASHTSRYGLQPNHALVLRSLKGWAAAVKPLVQESDAAKWTYADNDDGGD